MADPTISTERGISTERIDATGFPLVTGAQAEHALRSAIQRLERIDDSSLDLAQALIKLGTIRQEKGGIEEAEELFQRALDVSERTLGPEHIELVQPLTNLGSARILRGSPEAAEPLISRALSISTRYLGEDHPDLVIMVNDLARLYLKQGAYSFAEPLLQRLLAMKRTKGDDHPEVATVLASLAAVHQARGQHESAEDLWRRVLAIRERTLAPNHFAQATALEHLADVCTARGKFGEALQLFQRARMIRELTLGSDHSSLRISRERIADLQLQASEDSFEVDHARTPDDLRSADDLRINTPVARRPIREAKRRTRPEGATPVVEREIPRPFATNEEDAPQTTLTPPTDDAEEREAAALAYRAALLEERQNEYEADEGEEIGLAGRVLASATVLMRKHHREALAVAGVIAFSAIALAASTRASSETDQPIIESPSVAAASRSALAPHPLTATSDQLKVPAPSSAPVTRTIMERRTPEKVSEKRAAPPSISIPTLSSTMTNRFDSLVQATGAPGRIFNEAIPAPPELSATNRQRPSFAQDEQPAPRPSHARLIGSLPIPRYPDQLSGVEGEVLVRFTVDTGGRPEMTTFSAVYSPHELLTAAVRKVVKDLRFEPARSAGAESKAIVDPVEIRYQFSRSAR